MWIKIKDDNEVDLSVNIYKDELEIAQYDNVYIFIEKNVAFSTLELETGRKKKKKTFLQMSTLLLQLLHFMWFPRVQVWKNFNAKKVYN